MPSSCPVQAQGWLAGAWKKSKDWIQGAAKTVGITDQVTFQMSLLPPVMTVAITHQNFIDDFGEKMKTELGIDLTSHQKNSKWVQNAMNIFWLDFDLSANCLVAYSELDREWFGYQI